MEIIKYLYRPNMEYFTYSIFDLIHFIQLFIATVPIGIMYVFRNRIYKDITRRRLGHLLGASLVFVILVKYSWYVIGNKLDLREILPLYSCRLALGLCTIGLLFNNTLCKTMGAYLGFFGGLGALIFPDPIHYYIPHVTRFMYFGGHMILLWAAVFIILFENMDTTKENYKKCKKILVIFLLISAVVNYFTGANYNFTMKFPKIPIIEVVMNSIPQPFYLVVAISIFLMVMKISYIAIYHIRTKYSVVENEKSSR